MSVSCKMSAADKLSAFCLLFERWYAPHIKEDFPDPTEADGRDDKSVYCSKRTSTTTWTGKQREAYEKAKKKMFPTKLPAGLKSHADFIADTDTYANVKPKNKALRESGLEWHFPVAYLHFSTPKETPSALLYYSQAMLLDQVQEHNILSGIECDDMMRAC